MRPHVPAPQKRRRRRSVLPQRLSRTLKQWPALESSNTVDALAVPLKALVLARALIRQSRTAATGGSVSPERSASAEAIAAGLPACDTGNQEKSWHESQASITPRARFNMEYSGLGSMCPGPRRSDRGEEM